MNPASRSQRAKTRRALQWATRYFPCVSDNDPDLSATVRQLVSPWQVDADRQDSRSFPVTLEGFVTMAIVPQRAVRHESAIAVPGFDEKGNSGHLVLLPGARPYHSRASDPVQAIVQARTAMDKARRLEQAYGDRESLNNACRTASWFMRVTIADASAAGLCDWGIESFLRSLNVWFIARHFGLPKGAISLGGKYPRRAIAAAILRADRQRPAGQMAAKTA